VLPTNSRPARFIEIAGPQGELLFRSDNVDDALIGPPSQLYVQRIGTRNVRIGTFSEEGVTLRLGLDLEAVDALTRDLLIAYAVALPFVLAAVAFGGWWLARQALTPIREIADATERITAQRLDQRLAVPPLHDEIGRLAAVLNAMFDRLDISFRQAMRFSADASHELKTPLTILRSGIEDLLRSSTLSAEDERALAVLLEQTRQFSAITESLLLLSRADAGRLQLDLRPHAVSEVVAECIGDARIMAEPRSIEFETQLADGAVARLDRGRFTQILLNLLDNAVKYNREGGRICVSVTEAAGTISVAVANNGPGIARQHAAHLFERFYRADPEPATNGHGLGLNLARELARAHDGDITLSRTDAEWTEFRFTLPAMSSREPAIC
jgi:signal transduction histidine kinase